MSPNMFVQPFYFCLVDHSDSTEYNYILNINILVALPQISCVVSLGLKTNSNLLTPE